MVWPMRLILGLLVLAIASGCGAQKGRSGFVKVHLPGKRAASVERVLAMQHLRVGYDVWLDRGRKSVYYQAEPRGMSDAAFIDPECVGTGRLRYGKEMTPQGLGVLGKQVAWADVYRALQQGSDTRRPEWVNRVRHCLWQLGEFG